MIVIASRPGQLGNHLFLFAHTLAYGMEHGITINNPAFQRYRHYFRHWKAKQTVFPERSLPFWLASYAWCNGIARALHRSGISWPGIDVKSLDWTERMNLDEIPPNEFQGTTLLLGWLYRAPGLLAKHADQIRSLFELEDELQQSVAAHLEAARSACDLLVGIHIRRGDYARFEGGKYLYDIDDYARFMQSIVQQHAPQRVRFMVCSNEALEASSFGALDVVIGPGSEIGDLYGLAGCDLIAGPPSTYSLWASFIGNKPIWHIADRASEVPEFSIPAHY